MQVSGRPGPTYGSPTTSAPSANVSLAWTSLALIAALVATLGTLALSLDLPPVKVGEQEVVVTKNLKACALCFYQRVFAFGTLGVLLIGLTTRARRTGALGVMALPLAVGGAAIAGFHVWLEHEGKLECPKGLSDRLTAPQESAIALGILTFFLLIDSFRNTSGGAFGFPTILSALILGGAFAVGCIKTVPPMTTPPAEAYKKPPDGCRPPNPYAQPEAPPPS